MRLGRIAADDQNQTGILDVPDRSGIAAVTDGAEQTFRGGCLAVARAIIHVVRADDRARQLLHEVTFLVGAFRRGDEGKRIRSVLRLDLGETPRHQGQGFLPTCLAKLVAFADRVVSQPVAAVNEIPAKFSLHAGGNAVRRALRRARS